MQQRAAELGRPLPVAMVIGAHPLFMLAGAARLPYGVDERHVAGGLFGAPLEVVRTRATASWCRRMPRSCLKA